VQRNVSAAIQYLEAWLRGIGAVPIANLMEDAATAEISRSQLWSWLRHGVKVQEGEVVSKNMIQQAIENELQVNLFHSIYFQ
jgi:malate synthase